MKTTNLATSEKLKAVLPRLPHHIEMINRTVNGGYPVKLGVPLVEALETDLERFQNVITPLVSVEVQPNLYEALASLESPLATLRDYFVAPEASKMSTEDVKLLLAFIYDRVKELRTIAADIYSSYSWQGGFDYVLNPLASDQAA